VAEHGEQVTAREFGRPGPAQGLPVDRDGAAVAQAPTTASNASASRAANTRRNGDSSGTRTIPSSAQAACPASAAHSPIGTWSNTASNPDGDPATAPSPKAAAS
jgi:hypothetical protein